MEKESSRGRTEPQKDRCKLGGFSNSHPTARACAQFSSHLQLPECESANFSPSPPTAFHCLCPVAIHRLCRWRTSARAGQPLQPAKVDSSGKWHLWLWVVSDEEEQLGEGERGGERKRWREHGGCWEKIGTGSPFNLLINHANEILTGYSEAVLGGGRKALVLDYTLSMWRAKKEKQNMLLNKVMGNFLAHSSQAEPLTD